MTPTGNLWQAVWTHVELLDGRSAALVGRDHLDLHDLDGVGASAMAGAHVTICRQRRDGWRSRGGAGGAAGGYSQHCVTAPDVVRSRYSLYMLWVPLRES